MGVWEELEEGERGEDEVNAVFICESLKTIKSKLRKERMLEYYI